MALVDALLDKISDQQLREALREQVDNLLHKQSFGLVYQQHKPETVELPHYKVRRGCKVRIRSVDSNQLYRVEKVKAGTATVAPLGDEPEFRDVSLDNLVVVREFGEAVYPGLISRGRIDRGGSNPSNIVINGENFHALEALLYTHENKVDAIYIDPPYNSGARDWKYNNDYVDGVDQYRHSKWLAFMERRLKLARRLLAVDGILIVTIDENEVHHLGMLLEQLFPDARQQMVTIVNNSPGQARKQGLSRVEEYAFFLFFGEATPHPSPDDLLNEKPSGNPDVIRWESLLRSGTNSLRADRPQLFYPIFVNPTTLKIVEVAEPKLPTSPRSAWEVPRGAVAIWPLKSNGTEGRWKMKPSSLRTALKDGFAKVGGYRPDSQRGTIWYLGRTAKQGISAGEINIVGRDESGAVIVEPSVTGLAGRRSVVPMTVWNRPSHHAGWHGSAMVNALVRGRSFPFPKALYAVEDALRIAVGGNPNAVVVDFFAGSGTTAHAVARLNVEDSGRRQSILVTNNEVSVAEAAELSALSVYPGDSAWEERGIFYQFTMPRITAAITGVCDDNAAVVGEYNNGSPIAEGLPENVEFFDLTYEDADLISLGRKFSVISPLLWLKAGGQGGRIDTPSDTWLLPDDCRYGVLFDTDLWREFADAVAQRGDVSHAFIVTSSEATLQQIKSELPGHIDVTQLYEDYLRTFEINTRGSA